MTVVTNRRLGAGAVIVAVAVIVGVFFGYLAGIAVVLGVVTVILLGLAPWVGLDYAGERLREEGRTRFGSTTDEPRR